MKIETIPIPPLLKNLLDSQERIAAAARSSVVLYSEWLSHSRIPFFPEYTDHGPGHIASVVATGAQLLAADAASLLTPADAGFFVISVLLHDIAMHLTEDGFWRLVRGETTLQPIEAFGDRPWPTLWEEFRAEALRFSSAENYELFGDSNPVEPPTDNRNWSRTQYMLVGEFIRRHHPRLAHQIAISGFPGSEANLFTLDDLIDAPARDLVGVIARSHGMALRPCIDYLESEFYNRVDPLGAHVAFLMCLLRVADFFQIEASRSVLHLRLQSLRSPVSVGEHAKHLAIPQLTRDRNDDHTVRAIIRPEAVTSVKVYFGLQSLFTAIQKELDNSWAVIGEVFGRQTDRQLNRLGLNVRRFRSNLDDPQFVKKLGFEPVHLRFQSADSKLFKLLIRPLYGTDPDIGVREMVQNSIDAVRELAKYCERHGLAVSTRDVPQQDADVVVDIETDAQGKRCLVVKDAGIGMTLEVVRDYFLKIGASFRESLRWRKEFTDDKKHSSVLRTGYFGIGALASFLVGDEIQVSTRYVTSSEGLEFRATIDTDPIQVSRCQRPIGTTIRIPLRPGEQHWTPHVRFYLRNPSLLVCGRTSDRFYPHLDDRLPASWQRVPELTDQAVLWIRPCTEYADRVTHNGFMIEHGDREPRALWQDQFYGLRIFCPHLHIFDREGNRDEKNYLNLARNEFFQNEFEPISAVADDLLRDYLAFLLVSTAGIGSAEPTTIPTARESWWDYRYVECQLTNLNMGFSRERLHGTPWVFTSQGIAPFDSAVLSQLGIKTVLLSSVWHPSFLPTDPTVALVLIENKDSEAVTLVYPRERFDSCPLSLNIRTSRIMGFNEDASFSFEGSTKAASQTADQQLEALIKAAKALSLRTKMILGVWSLNNQHQVPSAVSKAVSVVQQALMKPRVTPDSPSLLVSAWDTYIGTPLIPYEDAIRREKLAQSYKILQPYIEAWQQLISQNSSV